eukprot:644926-Alexandrium_andersonii.AAC.1
MGTSPGKRGLARLGRGMQDNRTPGIEHVQGLDSHQHGDMLNAGLLCAVAKHVIRKDTCVGMPKTKTASARPLHDHARTRDTSHGRHEGGMGEHMIRFGR